MDGIQAIKDLEIKLRDVAFQVEDEIELQIVHLYQEEEDEELLAGIAGLFMEKPQRTIDAEEEEEDLGIAADLFVEKQQGETWHSFKLGCILEGAIRDIDAIQKELSKVKMECVTAALQGIGRKATLARRVYDDPSIASHFDKRVWVVVSQYHNKLQMLKDLLKSMGGCVVDSSTEEYQLAEQLYQNLLHQRYFVVIDDIWSVDAWDSIKACFPNNANGSRVLQTTCFVKVATSIGSNNDFSHQVQLLDQTESWNLLCEKASKSDYDEFEAIGRPIVEKCKGLPLAIVVAAGLFSKLYTLDELKNVAEALNSSATTTIDEECSRILSSSYNHLPHSLKACFLYLSIFPEGFDIQVKIIVRSWVAEGLVKASDDMSFDAVARRHIQELKDRSLILVNQASKCGRKVKTFRMHDLVHSFCVREAENGNLLHVVYDNESSSPPKDFRWVRVQSILFHRQTSYSLKNCRSIIFSSVRGRSKLRFCRLIRVLYNNLGCEIRNLVHLRYPLLWIRAPTILDPFHCWNLQALLVDSIDKMSFLEFPQLQYLRSYRGLSDIPIFFHQNLKSICGLIPDQCTKELVTNIPYLKKVEILCCKDGWSDDCINNLAYSHQLQSLHLRGQFRFPYVIPNINRLVCLKNLMRLMFTALKFEWRAINILSKLPKLEVLRLNNCDIIGEEWELLEKENFDQLIYLEIDFSCHLKQWEASASHFSNLERLILKRCLDLVKIPAEFAEIPNLKSIELLDYCLPSLVNSAKEIQKEQHEQGNENMVVIDKHIRLLRSRNDKHI